MRRREAVTETMAASEAKRKRSKVINRAFSGEVRFVVEKHGTPVAGIVSVQDIERLAELDARWAEGHEILKRFGRAFHDQTSGADRGSRSTSGRRSASRESTGGGASTTKTRLMSLSQLLLSCWPGTSQERIGR